MSPRKIPKHFQPLHRQNQLYFHVHSPLFLEEENPQRQNREPFEFEKWKTVDNLQENNRQKRGLLKPVRVI